MQFSIEDINSDPSVVISNLKTFSDKELDVLRSTLQCHRGNNISLVRTALSDLKTLRRHEKRNLKILEPLEAIFDRIAHLHTIKRTGRLISRHARSIAEDLHDFPAIWSGLESSESLIARSRKKTYKPCREHYWPRQCSGVTIMNSIFNPIFTQLSLAKLIYKFTKVHLVTKDENQRLKPLQKTAVFLHHNKPAISYRAAGITLVRGDTSVCFWKTSKHYEKIWKDILIGLQQDKQYKYTY